MFLKKSYMMKNNIYHLLTILFFVAFSKATKEKYLLVEIADEDLANYVKNSKSLKESPEISKNTTHMYLIYFL